MPILEYASGSHIQKFTTNGLIAIDTEVSNGIERLNLPANAVFLVQDHVVTQERWQGTLLPPHQWHPGSVAFLPFRTDLQSVTEQPFRETILTIRCETLIQKAKDAVEWDTIESRYCDITGPDTTRIARCLDELIKTGDSAALKLVTDSLVLSFVMAIASRFAPERFAKVERQKNGLDRARMRRVSDFIQSNLGNRISLEDLAGVAALSQYHFSRSFKDAMGMTPARYVLDRRIKEAQRLLKHSARPLSDIAAACGFASQSHFTTAFKMVAGKTPKQFRSV